MDPLLDNDVSNAGQGPRSAPFFKTAFQYGLLLGLANVILQLGAFVMGIDMQDPNTGTLPKMVMGIAGLVLSVFIYRMVMVNHRDQMQGGYLSLGQAISIGAIIGLAAGILNGLYIFIFGNFINPGYKEQLKNAMFELWEKEGLTEEMMETTWSFTQYMVDPNYGAIFQVIAGPIGGAIFGLIVGLFVKREFPAYRKR